MTLTFPGFEVTKILDDLPVSVSSICAWQSDELNLLIGTEDGTLVLYQPEIRSYGRPLLAATGRVSKKEISNIIVSPSLNLMLFISNYCLYVEQLNVKRFPSPFLSQIPPVKDPVYAFAYESQANNHLLATAHRKRVIVHRIKDSAAQTEQLFEVPISEAPISLTWCYGLLVASLKKEQYSIIDTASKRIVITLFNPSRSNNSMLCSLSPNELLLLRTTSSNNFIGATVDSMGRHTRAKDKCPIWERKPVGSFVSKSLFIVVFDRSIELRLLNSGFGLITTQYLNSDEIKHTCSCLGNSECYFIASGHSVSRFQANTFPKLVDGCLEVNEFEKALEVVGMFGNDNEAKGLKRQVCQAFGRYLFEQNEFESAFTYFLEGETPPQEVLALFPDLLPAEITKTDGILGSLQLDSAHKSLLNYLFPTRAKFLKRDQSEKVLSVLELIDTALIKSLARVDQARILEFLNSGQIHCSLSEISRVLKQKHLYREVLVLYSIKKCHKKAIELLFNLVQNNNNNNDSNQSFSYSDIAIYLAKVGNSDPEFVFHNAKKVLSLKPSLFLSVFTLMEEQMLIEPKLTIAFIEANQPSSLIPFYEHLIYDFNYQDTTLHNSLGKAFLAELSLLIESSSYYLPPRRLPAGSEGGKLGHLRNRFLYFLNNSNFYQPEYLLIPSVFPPTAPLFEERAILHKQLGNHLEVVSIFVFKLENVSLAEDYCNHVYKNDPNSKNIFLTLFTVLMSPPEGQKPLKKLAIDCLCRWSHNIDSISALDILDPSTKLEDILPFLKSVMDHTASKARTLSVHRNFLHLSSLKTMAELIAIQKRSVTVTLNSSCSICSKRIGSAAIAFLPDNSVCHFHCSAKVNK
ncbi:hypothetical protein P9112_003180 [Eukaryota sp. TZLM1-RC]